MVHSLKTMRGGGGGGELGGGGEGDGVAATTGGAARADANEPRHFDPALSDALVPSVSTAGVHAASSRVMIEASGVRKPAPCCA